MNVSGLDREAEIARQLWIAVLARMITDYFDTRPSLEKQQAEHWVGSRDFGEVCDLAGVCPKRLAARLLALRMQAGRSPGQTVRRMMAGAAA